MTIDPFVSYKLYQALKLHFESDTYDALKYNYKTSASPQSFFKRKDKYFFAKVGRKVNSQQELIEYYVVIIDKLTGFMNRADKEITEQLVWPDISRKVKKYKPFVNADMNKCKKIILEVFTN
jgi:hypothetical protein